jgi:hypothetical protein
VKAGDRLHFKKLVLLVFADGVIVQ